MKTVTTQQMREIDRLATEEFGIPSLLLMENAGRGIAEILIAQKAARVLVVCGKGNNGGDGFVTARHLHNRGCRVKVLMLSNWNELKPDAFLNWQIVKSSGISFEMAESSGSLELFGGEPGPYDWIVDAVFGTGLTRDVEEPYRSAIQIINRSGKPVLAVDVPSGLNSDSGEVMGVCVRASVTAVLGAIKSGLLCGSGPENCGTIYPVDIALPKVLLARFGMLDT